eukprot:5318747-Amphidinium_carterae.2
MVRLGPFHHTLGWPLNHPQQSPLPRQSGVTVDDAGCPQGSASRAAFWARPAVSATGCPLLQHGALGVASGGS